MVIEYSIYKTQPYESLNCKFIESSFLAPFAFVSKQMNITKDSLSNFFMMWNKALFSFLNKNMTHFDALVGENGCHIRAAILTDILLDINLDLFKEALKAIMIEIECIIDYIAELPITQQDTKKSIHDFLIKNNLLFFIPETMFHHVKFIIESYLLTLTKEYLPTTGLTLREHTNYRQIDDLGFAHNKTKSLVSNSQKSLSKACCNYIQSEAVHLNNPGLSSLLQIKYDAHERAFLSQFIVAKVLFQRFLEKNQSLVVKITRYFKNTPIDQMNLWFKPNVSKTDFVKCNRIPNNKACIVVAGVIHYESIPESEADYLIRLSKHSMLDIIYANLASHPQYAGELKQFPIPFNEAIMVLKEQINVLEQLSGNECKIHILKDQIKQIQAQQDDFEQKKIEALNNGCSLSNPSLLFLNHIYSDMIENHITTQIDYQQKATASALTELHLF